MSERLTNAMPKTKVEPQFEDESVPVALKRLMIVAGEASGDLHAAALVRSLKMKAPELEVFGMGGSRLRLEGAETVVDSEEAGSVMGITEVLGSISRLLREMKTLVAEAERRRPDVIVLIDFPDFNLRLAKKLKARGFSIVYFVTPQVWAWRTSRVKSIKRDFTAVLPIFPFEEAFFCEHGVEAHYVGHPFLDRDPVEASREQFLTARGLDPGRPLLALLPGSRWSEVERLIEPMIEAYRRLAVARPGIQAVIPVAATFHADEIRDLLGEANKDIVLVEEHAREILSFADVAIIASGTATVEAALAEIPCVVVYKLSGVTYRIARLLVRGVKNFAMANLVSSQKIVPELLQDEVTGARLSAEVERILGDPKKALQMKAALRGVRAKFLRGLDPEKKAAERAAGHILEIAERGASAGKPPQRRFVR